MKEYAKKPENQSRALDGNAKASKQAPIDVILQRYKERNIQRYTSAEEEEPLQGKFDTAQRNEIEEELLQGSFESTLATEEESAQRKEKLNNTGLPNNLKTGIENLSGYSMDDVHVHYSSDKPAQLNALAYAQGTDIHIAPGQEKHLPHEVWHIVQQKQGLVQPTMQLQSVDINDNEGLEKDADVMGGKASRFIDSQSEAIVQGKQQEIENDNYITVSQRDLSDLIISSARSTKTIQQKDIRVSAHSLPFVQLEAKDPKIDTGEELNKVLDNLENIVIHANQLAEQQNESDDFSDIALQIKELRVIANGNDDTVKFEILRALKEEMNLAGDPLPLIDAEPIQRVGALSGILIGAGIAAGLGLAAYRAYTYLRDRQEDAIVNNFFATGNMPVGGIPAELTIGLAGQPPAVMAARLFQNINNFRFRYVGVGIPAQVAFTAHQGDCGTLVLMYQAVAAAFGIPTVNGNIPNPMLVNAMPIHGRSTQGNTEGETDWYFQNHHWVIGNGVPYDLLFMVSPPPAHIAYNAPRVHNGVNYSIFADGRVLIPPGQAALGYDIQGEGRVFQNVVAANAFIVAHP